MVNPIGVLGLQGDFEAHIKSLAEIGVPAVTVRWPSDLRETSALIIPGGESTTLIQLMKWSGFPEELRTYAQQGAPIFGTCAGAILLARRVTNPEQFCLGLIDVDIERNAWGRQRESFETEEGVAADPDLVREGTAEGRLEMVFIRAPRIRRCGPGVRVLATYQGEPVLVQQENVIVATFHPEMGQDHAVHRYFAQMAGRAAAIHV